MKFFDRMRNGWHLGISSLELLRDHPKLLLFPVLSGITLLVVLLSFTGAVGGLAANYSEGMEAFFMQIEELSQVAIFATVFVFYLLCYFIITFFNVALIHSARQVFEGEEPSLQEGVRFSAQRSHQIFTWALVAATVGLIIQAIEERLGSLVSGILGFAWSMASYFVLPVLAYEGVGPLDAIKRSSQTIRERWGDAIGAGFSLGLFVLVGIVVAIVSGLGAGFVHPGMGVAIGVMVMLITFVVNGAARNIFLAAAYQHTQGNTPNAFDSETLDGIFMPK